MLFDFYGSDRGKYNLEYGSYYESVLTSKLFKHRCEVRRVLEIGIGSLSAANPGGTMSHFIGSLHGLRTYEARNQ